MRPMLGCVCLLYLTNRSLVCLSDKQDIRPLQEDMCDYYTSGAGYAYDNYYAEVIHFIIIS